MTLLRQIAESIVCQQPMSRRAVPSYPRIARLRRLRTAGVYETARMKAAAGMIPVRSTRGGNA